MLSVGRFAKLAKVSARTLRYYESIGLLPAPVRGENRYRYYDRKLLARVQRIRELQDLGFSLLETKEILAGPKSGLSGRLRKRLQEVKSEMLSLEDRRQRLKALLSATRKVEAGGPINAAERSLYMEAIQEEVLKGLKKQYTQITKVERGYLERDFWFRAAPEAAEFLRAVQKCVAFARKNRFQLGPGRGSSPASLALFGLGFSRIDPLKYGLLPERLSLQPPSVHIDVEFERGQAFVDFCRETNRTLRWGEIQAFRMPLLDILNHTHQRIGEEINYGKIDENGDPVLQPVRAGEIEKVFGLDFSPQALVMKYENLLPGYGGGPEKLRQYLVSQQVRDFRDVMNIQALWRPHSPEILERLERYRRAKRYPLPYAFLSAELQESLAPNFGQVIYHEDLMRILSHYTGWDLGRCNTLRRAVALRKEEENPDWREFLHLAPEPVAELVKEESRWAFCQAHVVAFAQLTKQTAVLKSLHRDAYYAEIDRFEQKHGFAWDDIGIRAKGVSLLQD
jgi:DNA-binding transcriptional MerR regulator